MAKVRQPYDEPVAVAWLGGQVVNPGQVVQVSDEQLPGFLEAGWTAGDAATRAAAEKLRAAANPPGAAGDTVREG